MKNDGGFYGWRGGVFLRVGFVVLKWYEALSDGYGDGICPAGGA